MSLAVDIHIQGSIWELIGKGLVCLVGVGTAFVIGYLAVLYVVFRG